MINQQLQLNEKLGKKMYKVSTAFGEINMMATEIIKQDLLYPL